MTELFVIMNYFTITERIYQLSIDISMDLSIDQWLSNNMKVILCNFAKGHCSWTIWTLNNVDVIPFSCIGYFQMAHNQAK